MVGCHQKVQAPEMGVPNGTLSIILVDWGGLIIPGGHNCKMLRSRKVAMHIIRCPCALLAEMCKLPMKTVIDAGYPFYWGHC